MSVLRIVTVRDEDPVLRAEASPVRCVDGQVRRLMDDMVDTMRDAPGVGLAAPQVGVSRAVIVVETPTDPDAPDAGHRLLTLADPEIVWSAESIEEDQEACLSIPALYGDVPRAVSIRVRALDRDGNQVDLEAHDFEARVLQHEIDHLHGILFTDRVTGIDKLYTIREDASGDLVRVPYATPSL